MSFYFFHVAYFIMFLLSSCICINEQILFIFLLLLYLEEKKTENYKYTLTFIYQGYYRDSY